LQTKVVGVLVRESVTTTCMSMYVRQASNTLSTEHYSAACK
jgi:hypothetical protein